MRYLQLLVLPVVMLSLAACGGAGSGGPGSIPSPVPTPAPTPAPTPTPTPTPSLPDLTQSLNLTDTAASASTDLVFNLDTGAARDAATGAQSVSFVYNQGTNTYTVSSQGRSASFRAADLSRQNTTERVFRTENGDRSELLTLVDRGYETGSLAKYVRLAYWQSNVRNGRDQETLLEVFPYGYPTSSTNVPLSGTFDFATDLFGLTTQAGRDPLAFSGNGLMVVDLQRGTFALDANFAEFYFTTGQSRTGALYFTASGRITSGTRAFDGAFSYDNTATGMAGQASGNFTGAFYGPSAQEAGGTIIGGIGNTTTIGGGWTAIRNASRTGNAIVSDLRRSTLFLGPGYSQSFLLQDNPATPTGTPRSQFGNRTLSYDHPAKSLRLSGLIAEEGQFAEADRVTASGSPYITYERTRGANRYQLQLYRPETGVLIELTYSSFARYLNEQRLDGATLITRDHLVYGIETLDGVLSTRTGAAIYRGIALGNGINNTVTSRLDLDGTAQFAVDFGTDTLTGWVDLAGREQGTGRALAFGRFDLDHSGAFSRTNLLASILADPTDRSRGGTLGLRFYGPNAEELSGAFEIFADGYLLGGVVLAKEE